MEKQEKKQQENEEKDWQFGCFEPSSGIGRMMMKMMKKMCGSRDTEHFDCESMMSELNWCKESR